MAWSARHRWALVALATSACALPDADLDGDGYAVSQGDCDDLLATVHPEADDAPGDGVDQDCDGIEVVLRAEGLAHGCELDDTGAVACFGDGTFGQTDPPYIAEEIVDLAAGSYHTCALTISGRVSCWGLDRFGQASPPALTFDAIGASEHFSMGRRYSGEWVCWGACVDARPF
jgi:hypothetical protein